MLPEEQFCLRLQDFERNICNTWQNLRNEKELFDVTFACDDKQIQAHKIVISSSSPVLRNIIKLFSHTNPLIYLRGVRYKDMENLVDFNINLVATEYSVT